MKQYVEIINSAKVRSNTNLVIQGIRVNKAEWAKSQFYPNNGVVGIVIGEAQSCEGLIYLVQCGNGIIVPVLPSGIKNITADDFNRRYPNNKSIGKATDAQMNSTFDVDEMMDSMNRFFGF